MLVKIFQSGAAPRVTHYAAAVAAFAAIAADTAAIANS